jgi:hypothetical protein
MVFQANRNEGIGLSTFGGCLATIYYFKPQTALVSQVFLAVVSYVIGEAMAKVIPSTGWIGRLFNPHPVGFELLSELIQLILTIDSSTPKNMLPSLSCLPQRRTLH